MLALASGAFLGGSGAMAQVSSWESVYEQTQTTSDSWTALTSSTASAGMTLGATGTTSYYYAKETLNLSNSTAGGSGLVIKGTVYLYIPYGVHLTCVGGNASGTTGAGAGIELATGNTLYIIGSGDGSTTVTATGGNAANGSKGGDGTDATGNSSWLKTGTGGDGGVGGGGAGAGIGTRGGTGGADEAMAFIQAMVGVSRENFEATLDLIDQRYGSLSAYIENQLGFSKEEQQQLRAKYLTN